MQVNQLITRIFIAVFSVLALFSSSCSAFGSERGMIINPKTEGEIQEIITRGELPSVQIAVISQGQLAWSKVFGQNSGDQYVYMNGSVQKVVDATAILQLHERGWVDLDDDISDYLPFDVRHPGYPQIPITIRMLLSHRSGLDAIGDQFPWDTECLFVPKYRPDCKPENLKMPLEAYLMASFTPDGSNYNPAVWIYKPGEKYHYSVSAYPLLRYLIEQVTGVPYPDYMKINIFDPLGMERSGFSAGEFDGQHAHPYTRIDGQITPLSIWNGNGYMMRTTAEDMASFMLAHMANGSYKDYQLLKPETIELMRIKESRGRSILNPKTELTDAGYGLGLIHYQGDWMGHGGSTVGYQSLWKFNPTRKCGFIIITNLNGILGGKEDSYFVWDHVAAIQDVLMRQMDLLATFDFFPVGFILVWAAILFWANLLIRWRRKRRTAAQDIPVKIQPS